MQRLQWPLLPAAVCLLAQSVFGQTSRGTIAGTVTDPTGSSIVAANVTAKNTLGADVRTVTTGPNGEYRIDAVLPSTYAVSVTAPGFSTKSIADIHVDAGVVTSVNVQLEVGGVSQTVAVEASGALIQTESGEMSGTITAQQVSQLPIVTGNPIDLVLTQPGVVPVSASASFTNGEGFSVDGHRPRANNFLLDGFDDNDYGIQGQALQPTVLEATQEVNIQTNSYAPEFGRGGSSVTNVISKNGTNAFHGTAWEAYQGSALTAIPVELKNDGVTVTPQFVENTFGFDIGGPLVRNKLFLFGSAQWLHLDEDESGSQLTIPTAAGVSSLQSIGTNANVNLLLSSLGGLTAPTSSGTINVGNRPGCGSPCLIQVGQEILTPKALDRDYQYIIRGDYVASDKDTFMARFIGSHNFLSPDLFANSAALPTQETYQGGPSDNFGMYWTHVYSPTKLNEFRFTAQSISFLFGLLPSTASSPLYQQPNVSIAGLDGVSFGTVGNFPQGRSHNVYEYQDAYSIIAGNHSFKMGADLVHLTENDTNFINSIGSVIVTAGGDCSSIGLATCTGLANYIDNYTGPAGSAGKGFGNPVLSTPMTLQSFYFQDAWKLRPNFTLTYGVRYEYQGTPLNALAYPAIFPGVEGLLQGVTERVPEQPDKNNFGPRAGFAYTPRFWQGLFGQDKTVFRGGFGVFYDTFFTNISVNGAETSPNLLGGTTTAPGGDTRGLPNALGIPGTVTPSVDPFASVDTAVNNLQNPLTYQWNFNIERQLPWNVLFTVGYAGSRGERLFLNEQMNPGIDGVRIDPDRGSILARTNLGNSSYNGLVANVERRAGNFTFTGSYTWSKSLDNGSEVFTNTGTSSQGQDLFNYGPEKGPSAFDIPQRGVISLIYQEPWFRHTSGFVRVASWPFRDWQISSIMDWQSGIPQTISFDGYDQNGDLNFGNDRPDLGNPNAPINYSPACLASPTCITGVGQVNPNGSLTDWNTGAPGTLADFRYIATNVLGIGPNGNLGRNTVFNPGRQDYEVALQRNLKLPWEGKQLEFRAEAYNLFNHPNAGGGSNADGNPVEGGVPEISGDILSPVFLNKSVTFVGGRYLQLWLKFRF